MFKNLVIILIAVLFVFTSACSPAEPVLPPTDDSPGADQPVSPGTPTEGGSMPLVPLPGDENMQRGNVFIDEVEILVLESFPPQFNLIVRGNLPTPCHQLRWEAQEPDAQNRIEVEVYSLVNPDEMCIQVLQSFEEVISLGSFPDGKYTIWVNGQQSGEVRTP